MTDDEEYEEDKVMEAEGLEEKEECWWFSERNLDRLCVVRRCIQMTGRLQLM